MIEKLDLTEELLERQRKNSVTGLIMRDQTWDIVEDKINELIEAHNDLGKRMVEWDTTKEQKSKTSKRAELVSKWMEARSGYYQATNALDEALDKAEALLTTLKG